VQAPLETTLAGISLRNPVLLAAGTCGTLDELAGVLDLSRIGGLVTKSITRQPRDGNQTWRIIETRHGGMMNAIGLANPGIDAFEETYLPRAASLPCAVIASVAGYSVEDYVAVAATFDEWSHPCHRLRAQRAVGASDAGNTEPASPPETRTGTAPSGQAGGTTPSLSAIELNVSCPNVKAGCDFGSSPAALKEVVSEVRKVVTRATLIVKLSPWPTGLPDIARAAIDAGADALTISNTMPAMAIDVQSRRPRLANITGGLSGPAIHPVVVKLIHEVYRSVARPANVPIIGAGGVLRWEDAAEFILAGATAIQMGTALFVDPRSPLAVAKGLESWVRKQGCASISELVGAVRIE
jgi:dihydroorotate dehydrogenase (NAD+) catalytic subunit